MRGSLIIYTSEEHGEAQASESSCVRKDSVIATELRWPDADDDRRDQCENKPICRSRGNTDDPKLVHTAKLCSREDKYTE